MKLLLASLLTLLPALAGEWAKIANADDSVIAIVRHPDGWSPEQVAHKYGVGFEFRFVAVTNIAQPVYEPIIYTLTATNRVTATTLERDWIITRRETAVIVLLLKIETARRVKLVADQDELLGLTTRCAQLLCKQTDTAAFETRTAGLTVGERVTLAAIENIFARITAIRANGKTLQDNAANITEVGGWPE